MKYGKLDFYGQQQFDSQCGQNQRIGLLLLLLLLSRFSCV